MSQIASDLECACGAHARQGGRATTRLLRRVRRRVLETALEKVLRISSKTKGPGENRAPRNHPEISCLRNWPISGADFPMSPMAGTEHHVGPF